MRLGVSDRGAGTDAGVWWYQVLAYCVAVLANLTYEPSIRVSLLDLGTISYSISYARARRCPVLTSGMLLPGLARFFCKMLDVSKNGLVVTHVCIGIRNLVCSRSAYAYLHTGVRTDVPGTCAYLVVYAAQHSRMFIPWTTTMSGFRYAC
eukprot:2496481-Rhodomonas_salina.1